MPGINDALTYALSFSVTPDVTPERGPNRQRIFFWSRDMIL